MTTGPPRAVARSSSWSGIAAQLAGPGAQTAQGTSSSDREAERQSQQTPVELPGALSSASFPPISGSSFESEATKTPDVAGAVARVTPKATAVPAVAAAASPLPLPPAAGRSVSTSAIPVSNGVARDPVLHPAALLNGQQQQQLQQQPIAAPAVSAAPPARHIETIEVSHLQASFNGFGKCAVFPVPNSSFSVSIWTKVMQVSSNDLSVNPFASSLLPISELLELTLPPVDAIGLPVWPRPPAHYNQAVASATMMIQSETVGMRGLRAPSPGVAYPVTMNNPPIVNDMQQQPPQLQVQVQVQQPSEKRPAGVNHIAALQQVLPTVKMSYAAPGRVKQPVS